MAMLPAPKAIKHQPHLYPQNLFIGGFMMRAFTVTFWKGGEFCGESQSDSWERIFRSAADEVYDDESGYLIAEISRNHSQNNLLEDGQLLNLEHLFPIVQL